MRHLIFRAALAGTLLATLALGAACTTSAPVRLPAVIGPNMVLQQGKPLPVWGWASPGDQVTVEIAGNCVAGKAGPDGRWSVRLPSLPAGGPHTMTVVRGADQLKLDNVLVGEVWVCSGQSNMEWGILATDNGEAAAAAADHPRIRLFETPHVSTGAPRDDVEAEWRVCSPETIAKGPCGDFSAVAYYFGLKLQEELGVPVGLIDSSWGGTRIEPWAPPEGFAWVSSLEDISEQIAKADADYEKALAEAVPAYEEWLPKAKKALGKDEPPPSPPGWPGHALSGAQSPTALYNGMIRPLVPFTIRGAIWYQGCANVGDNNGPAYHEKMKALIAGWRKVWGVGDFPFYFVQLAPFTYGGDAPHRLPAIWEAQRTVLDAMPETGMAVVHDTVTNVSDIHPRNKLDVGNRLAFWALANTYGQRDLEYSGPLFDEMKVVDGRVRLVFDHAAGLTTRDGKAPDWFEVAGADGEFVNAEAEIAAPEDPDDDPVVIVWSSDVAEPRRVRYAWHQTAQPNLMNGAGLPASPFQAGE